MKIPEPKKTASGEWRIQLRLAGKSTYVYGKTAAECRNRAALIKSQHAVSAGGAPNFGDMTLKELLSSYIDRNRLALSPSTIRGYVGIVNNRFTGYMRMKVKSIDFQCMVNDEFEECSRKTVKNAWGLVSAALRDARISFTPAKVGKVAKPRVAFLPLAQIRPFLDAVRGEKYEIEYLLGLNGLRLSEIMALTYQSYDPNENVLHIRGAVVPDESNRLVEKRENKNDTSARTVPVLIERLAELLRMHAGEADHISSCNRCSPTRTLKRLCEAEGFTVVTMHGLRHTFAAFCYHKHVPQRIIMQWGGWKDQKTLDDIYLALYGEDIAHQREIVAKAFSENA